MSQEYSEYSATSPAETLIIHFCINITTIPVKKMTVKPLGCNYHGKVGGGGQGGLKLPLPVPFNPGSHPVFVGSHLFAF